MHRCYHVFLPASDLFIQFSLLFSESRAGLEKLCVALRHFQQSLILLSHFQLCDTNTTVIRNVLNYLFLLFFLSKLTSKYRSAYIPLFDCSLMSSFLKDFTLSEFLQLSVS